MALESAFCHACQRLVFDQSRILDEEYRGYRGFLPLEYEFEDDFPFLPSLALSAKGGCQMCAFLNRVICGHCMSDPLLAESLRRETKKLEDHPGETPKRLSLVLSGYLLSGSRMLRDLRSAGPFYIHGQIFLEGIASTIRIEVLDEASEPRRYFPDSLPLADTSLRLINDWLSRCVNSKSEQHAGCSKAKENIAPLRLLDIMEGDTVRLVETEGLLLNYAILSYCWGTQPGVAASRTVTTNVSARKTAFSISSLPQTLQDSITVTRRLKIPYIWIDSLCIVQDSDEWLLESKRMMDYYENSYLTIIPIVCSAAEQGFLGPRPLWISTRLTGMWRGQPNKELHFHYPRWGGVDTEAAESVWATRAWTFQERLLSARTVYFGRNGIRFECRGSAHQEVNLIKSDQDNSKAFIVSPNHQSSEWDHVSKVRSMWYLMLSEYAERQLTFESDRLIAISGVAQKFGIYFGENDEYISGFWKNDLCHGLCWRSWIGWSKKLRDTWSLTKSPSFPTWSWCSARRPVTWTDGTCSIQCAELLGKVKSSDDKTCGGRGEYAKLLLETWVFSARLLELDPPSGLEVQVRLDADEELLLESFNVGDKYVAIVMSAYLDGGDEDQWTTSPTKMLHEVYGLIVDKAETMHEGIQEYRRVGTFDILLDMEVDSSDDSKYAAKAFYEGVYASRSKVVLI